MLTLSPCHLVALSSLPLADADDGAGKLIGALVFLAIWAIAGIGSWLKKQQEQQRRQPRPSIPAPPPPPMGQPQSRAKNPRPLRRPAAASRRPVPPPMPQAPPPPPWFQAPAKQQRRSIPAPPAAEQRPAPAPAPESPAVARPRPRLAAPAIAGWLKPKTLRQQFILTEVFQPPISMREPRE